MFDTRHCMEKVLAAKTPADLFARDPDEAKHQYRRLQVTLHPDRRVEGLDTTAAYQRLTELWAGYTAPVPAVIHGDIADLFRRPEGMLKVPRSHRDNDLLAREARALKTLGADSTGAQRVFFPELRSTQRQRDPATRIIRRVNLLAPLEGFCTLEEVEQAYPYGVHPRDGAWMWRRLLAALGAAHSAGIIHGAVLPPHVMIHPEQHGLVLIDWCYSAIKGEKIPAIVSRYGETWYPYEVKAKKTPVPATDIAMAAHLMKWLMGSKIPRQLQAFANGCILPSRHSRPDDARALIQELDDLLERLFGPKKFHPFTMPARA